MNCYKNEAIPPVFLSKKKAVRRFLQHLACIIEEYIRNADTLHYAKEWITMANKEKRFETIYTQGTSLSIVVDTETGVNYLVHDTGITPLLDKNGTVVITEINK